MTRCLAARTVTISLTRPDSEPQFYDIVVPSLWTEGQLRVELWEAHPEETVEILTWGQLKFNDAGFPVTWLINPQGFTEYQAGTR